MDTMTDPTIEAGAMPLLPSYARKPWDTHALIQQFGAAGTSAVLSAAVGTAVVGGSVLRDAGSVQGPPRVPR